MKQTKLSYRFHNPNTAEAAADALLKIFLEANQRKAETAIRQAAGGSSPDAALRSEPDGGRRT